MEGKERLSGQAGAWGIAWSREWDHVFVLPYNKGRNPRGSALELLLCLQEVLLKGVLKKDSN